MSILPQRLLSNESIKQCIENIKNLPEFTAKDEQSLLNAAVLVPVCIRDGEVHLLFTLRSTNLRKHGGQVSFPGGKMDEGENIFMTALRETEEEIGYSQKEIDIWYKMPSLLPNKDMLITPVVGFLKSFDFKQLIPNSSEVDEIFTVSMESLCDVNNHAYLFAEDVISPIFISGRHIIWGITGFITHLFLQCFLPDNIYNPNFTRKLYKFDELVTSKL